MQKVIITGSSGLVGSEAVRFFNGLGWSVIGIDCDARKEFFGPEGSTAWNGKNLLETCKNFTYFHHDIRDYGSLCKIFSSNRDADLILHTAAQPAHDYSWNNPLNDFHVNALGTVHVLEAIRQYCPEAIAIYTSTSKVYGTHVNNYSFVELPTRYDYYSKTTLGIDEECPIDQHTIHSLFGASKLSADIMWQEYANYFGLRGYVLRPGCITGGAHSGVELHGFLNYLVKCVLDGKNYNVFDDLGGKRVRDNIHAYDLVTACHEIYKSPCKTGTVFNIGGCKHNSISILEALIFAEGMTGKKALFTITNKPRLGDHIVYISDMRKFKSHYPNWKLTYALEDIFKDIIEGYTLSRS